ncbi:GNAT family N-acetyltransferase [Pseudooctadecabacter sp.]|uniref:GNAT family N-acetyltransferase n=1 Tax=Pseudooctadecabacter sp. TaxID=1966338 RepID=UPI0025EC1E43|nr:GNAT family N-acetyltransferase [Pseudooctadecabacter sp.]
MRWRAATDDDVPQMEDFLQAHLETSMFLVSNLRRFGPAGADHDYAMRYWVTGSPISGVFALATNGAIMVQWPDAGDWSEPLALVDRSVTRLIGESGQIAQLRHAAGLDAADTSLNSEETLFSLALDKATMPDGPGHLRRVVEADRPVLRDWMLDYDVNTLGLTRADAEARVDREFDAALAAGSRRILAEGETPLCLTGFNAVVDDIVQVGPVYTPPEHRGKGHARRAVALHLQEARKDGANRSILFATDPSAIAAYRAVGFRPIGRFSLIFFEHPQVLA